MKTLEEIVQKANKEYEEALRGRDYQRELLENPFSEQHRLYITNRYNLFTERICIIEDIFGSLLDIE